MAIQARTEFASALNQIASEKGVEVSVILSAIEQAALAAYRKDLSLRGEEIPEDFDSLIAKIDPVTGEIAIMRGQDNVTPPGFARIAAQTAKQVIMQRLHEAEKGAIMEEYDKKVGTIISGSIQRQEGNTYFIDLGRAEGVMPPSEQTRDEYYHPTQRLKFFIKEIRESGRGPEVIVSRTDPGLVKGLFAMEVPEIQAGTVVIKDIAREAGGRTKLSAISTQEGVDPVGSLVGQKGVRVQTVINELGDEKIDIISYSEDPARYVASALSPAKDVIVHIEASDGEKVAKVKVPDSQLSLAIGKGGQNVRLAAKLTGYKIDIEGVGEGTAERKETPAQATGPTDDTQTPVTDDTSNTELKETTSQDKTEEIIDQATEAEAKATQPEPTAEQAFPTVEDAAEDMTEELKKESEDSNLGSEAEPVDTTKASNVSEKPEKDTKDQDQVEEQKNA